MDRARFDKNYSKFFSLFAEFIPTLQDEKYITYHEKDVSFECNLDDTDMDEDELRSFKAFCHKKHPLICGKCEFDENTIKISHIPYWKYKIWLYEHWNPLDDEQLRRYMPESFKKLNDLQPKHLQRQGSDVYIQKAFMTRLKESVNSDELLLLFDNKSLYVTHNRNEFYNEDAKEEPTFSLNIKYRRTYIGGYSRFKNYHDDYYINSEVYDKFKLFMKPKIEGGANVVKSNHQGCYLIQLNCDKDTNKYKIGKSSNLLTRLKSTEYRNAYIYIAMFVQDEGLCEQEIIRTFTDKFELVAEDEDGNFGKETFRGNIYEMIKLFQEVCNKYINMD